MRDKESITTDMTQRRQLRQADIEIYSQLSRCITARGSISGLSLGGPTKVKARESFLFTEGSLKVENKEHLFDFIVTLLSSKIRQTR